MLSHVQLFCDPMDYTVYGILQARIMEWVSFPSPEDLPNPEIEPRSPTLQAYSLPAEPPGKPRSIRKGLGKGKQNPLRVLEKRDRLRGIGYVSDGKDHKATKGQ